MKIRTDFVNSTPIRDGEFRLALDGAETMILDCSEAEAIKQAQALICDGATGVALAVCEGSRWYDVDLGAPAEDWDAYEPNTYGGT